MAGCRGCFWHESTGGLGGGGLAEPCSPPAAGVPLAPPSSPRVEGRPKSGKRGLGTAPRGCWGTESLRGVQSLKHSGA